MPLPCTPASPVAGAAKKSPGLPSSALPP